MADLTNPFLQSPYQAIIDSADQPKPLPGSQAVKDTPLPTIPASKDDKEDDAPAAAPAPTADPQSLLPPPQLRPMFETVASHFKVPVNVLMALVQQESSYNAGAKNDSGATGMAQYLPATAKSLGINPNDPNEAIPAMAQQLRERLDKGMSMADAVREHFAGPDRKLWGSKTAAYGDQVLAKAGAIGQALYGDDTDAQLQAKGTIDLGSVDPGVDLSGAGSVSAAPQTDMAEVTNASMTQPPAAKPPAAQAPVAQPAQPTGKQPSMLDTIGGNAIGGLLSTIVGAVAANAHLIGAEDVAKDWANGLEQIKGRQKELGGDTFAGKTASLVGGIVPAMVAAPESKVVEFIQNSGMFGVPAFQDTYKQKLADGDSNKLALVHAFEAFGMNTLMPTLMTKGTGAIVGKLGSEGAAGLKGAALGLGQAASEGVGFSAANSVLDKGTDVLAGQQNDRPWIDPQDMAVQAAGFGVIRGAHMAPQIADAALDKAAPNLQVARALNADINDTNFNPDSAAAIAADRMTPDAYDTNAVSPQDTVRQAGDVGPSPMTRTAPPAGPLTAALDSTVKSAAPTSTGNPVVDQMLAIRPMDTAPAGPLESALTDAAAQHAANPAPLPEQPAASPQLPDLTQMSIGDLRNRLKDVAQQAVSSPDQRKALNTERQRIEQEIGARGDNAVAQSKPATEPLSAGPFDNMKQANSMMERFSIETGQPHQVVPQGEQFVVKPLGEVSNGIDAAGYGAGGHDGRGSSSGQADSLGAADGSGRAGTGATLVDGRAGTDGQLMSDAGARGTATNVAANHADAVANPYKVRQFPDQERATAFLGKQADGTQFEAIQTGPKRWQVQPRAVQEQSAIVGSKTIAKPTMEAKPAAQVEMPTRDTRGTGVRFHGTSRPLPDGRPNNEYAMAGDNRNIYGQGFYTTDAADISEGYMRKGKHGQPTLYEVNERPGAKLYDMEKPMTPEVRAMAERAMGDAFPERDIDGKPINTLRELFDEYRDDSANNGLTRDEVQETFDAIRYNLEQQGYHGYEHIGGLKTNKQPHNVRIYWTPEDHIEVSPSDIAKYKGEAADVSERPQVPEEAPPAGGTESTQQAAAVDDQAGAAGEVTAPSKPQRQPFTRELTNARQEEAVRQAAENIAKRKAEKEQGVGLEGVEPSSTTGKDGHSTETPDSPSVRTANDPDAIELQAHNDSSTEPDALNLTPKQYHEAKLAYMAKHNDVPMAEVREFYDNEASAKAHQQEWVDAVRKAAKDGAELKRATLDKLEEIRPGATASILHDYPEAKIPEGYQTPQARKIEAEKKDAIKADRAEIKAEHKAAKQKVEVEAAPAADIKLSVGKTPNSAEAVTVKDGVIHIGDYPAQHYDTGEDVTVPKGSTGQDIKDALVKSGAIGKGQKVFGLPKGEQEHAVLYDVPDHEESPRSEGDRREQPRGADDRRTIEVDGVRRPIRDASGRLIAGGDFMKQQAFWKWAGDTKVVDEQGRPLVVYHGTGGDFTVFDENVPGAHWKMPGMYFAPDAADASRFAEASAKVSQMKQGKPFAPEGANVMPVYLSLKNPKVIEFGKRGSAGFIAPNEMADMIREAKFDGHDGAIIKGWQDGSGEVQYVAFKPEQIKSATGNDGRYDPNDANITRDITPLMRDNRAVLESPRAADDARGADQVAGELRRARDAGEIDKATANFALWALDKSPSLARDLRVNVRDPGEIGAAGSYNSAQRIMNIFRGNENPGTAMHEILHHSERMMPAAIQAEILKAWQAAYDKAYAEGDAKTRAALVDMKKMATDRDAAGRVIAAFRDGSLKYGEHYQLSNPSEYWAVNATRIMAARHAADSWQAKAKNWLSELGHKVKGWLGLPSDAPILKALDSVIAGTGEQVSPQMLVEQMAAHDAPELRDITAPREGDPDTPEVPDSARAKLAQLIGRPVAQLRSAAHTATMLVSPMDAGTSKAQAWAKTFANSNRRAQEQWKAMDTVLRKNYNDAQLRKMWQAADEENDLRRNGQTASDKGLNSLPKDQREVVDLLHAYGEQLWQRAKNAGLVDPDAEGVAYWTPRMAANIYADGNVEMLRGSGGEFSKDAKNLRTSANSTKHRKYDTTAESEEALKTAKGDDAAYVKNIRVMPLAMAQLEKAIAGRTLVNQVKAHGQLTGDEITSDEKREGFDTFDHPALKKWHVTTDENGNTKMVQAPVFVRKDFVGPLKAVLTSSLGNKAIDNTYRGLMQLKGASMSVIMASPMTHNAVIWGKAMPSLITSMGWKRNLLNAGTAGGYTYYMGHQWRQDRALMNDLIDGGLVPMSGRGMNPDLEAIGNGLKPGKSLLAQALGRVLDVASPKAGDAARKAVDAAGHFWHETLLWDRIGDMQVGMAVQIRNHLMDQGVDQYVATRVATHFANRYAGAIPQEALSQHAHALLNTMLFSKSFTGTNLGAMKDPIAGLPQDVRAQIREHFADLNRALGKTDIEAYDEAGKKVAQAQGIARRKAGAILLADFSAMAAVTTLTQAYLKGQNGQQFLDDLKKRAQKLSVKLNNDNPLSFLGPQWGKVGLPLAALRHPFDNLESLSQTSDNPHGKQDRIRIGQDEHGNSYYMRLPVGKVVEEMKGYTNLSSGSDLINGKASPLVKGVAESWNNKDFFGRTVYDKDANVLVQAAQVAGHIAKSLVPYDDLVAAKNLVSDRSSQMGDKVHVLGKDMNMDEAKLMGTATGLSVSKLTGGDALAEMRYEAREQQQKLNNVLPDVKDAVQHGEIDKAAKMLQDAGQTPQEISRTLRQVMNPNAITKGRMNRFIQHASPEQVERVSNMMQQK